MGSTSHTFSQDQAVRRMLSSLVLVVCLAGSSHACISLQDLLQYLPYPLLPSLLPAPGRSAGVCESLYAWAEECPPDNGGYTWAHLTHCQGHSQEYLPFTQ